MNILDLHEQEALMMPELVETPANLRARHPLRPEARADIENSRREVADILAGRDGRLLVVLGPCSLDAKVLDDGTPAVLRLAEEARVLAADAGIYRQLKIVMRCPPAKPRTDLGWAGLEQTDLRRSHELLTDIANMGVPLAVEVLHERHLARYGDMLSLGWLGARDVSSTLLRHAVSAHPYLPFLCKNAEDGSIVPAVLAVKTISQPHIVELTGADGRLQRQISSGNQHAGLVVRGGRHVRTPGQFEAAIHDALDTQLPVIIDCAHGGAVAHDPHNQKSLAGQLSCLEHVKDMIGQGQPIRGLMMETHLLPGADPDRGGMSSTDPCLGIEEVRYKIRELAVLQATITSTVSTV